MTIHVALLDRDELAWWGLKTMLASVGDECRLVTVRDRERQPVDIALMETSSDRSGRAALTKALADPHIDRVAVWTWNHHPGMGPAVIERGAAGYLDKGLPGPDLLRSLREIHAGRTVVAPSAVGPTVEGSREGHHLTPRERETLHLIGTGLSNDQIGAAMGLTTSSVRSHLKNAYRKIGVTSRSQAVLWCVARDLRATHAPARATGGAAAGAATPPGAP